MVDAAQLEVAFWGELLGPALAAGFLAGLVGPSRPHRSACAAAPLHHAWGSLLAVSVGTVAPQCPVAPCVGHSDSPSVGRPFGGSPRTTHHVSEL